jgi:Zn-dependent oligopeptidase
MSDDDLTAARLASSSARDLTAATDAALAAGRAGIEEVKSADDAGEAEILERYDEAMAVLGDLTGLLSMIGKSNPDQAVREAADACYQRLSTELTGVSLDPGLYAVRARPRRRGPGHAPLPGQDTARIPACRRRPG